LAKHPKNILRTAFIKNKGEIVAIKNGHIADKEEAYRLDNEIGDFSLQISDEFYICAKTKEKISDKCRKISILKFFD